VGIAVFLYKTRTLGAQREMDLLAYNNARQFDVHAKNLINSLSRLRLGSDLNFHLCKNSY